MCRTRIIDGRKITLDAPEHFAAVRRWLSRRQNVDPTGVTPRLVTLTVGIPRSDI